MIRLLFLIGLLAGLLPPGFASAAELGPEMAARIIRVPEFEFLRAEAKKLGIRVYLFGGTAASYAHYVREDLLREAGDARYPASLYDYDYTHIFRSTQDLDVVIDGTAAQAEQLEQVLRHKFPHFIGDKAAKWEVRTLRYPRGDKEAILNSPNFQNQHTDSHSTGAVEVTETPKGEPLVRDVRDWESAKPQFLRDVENKELHYYYSPLHETTARFKAGKNPPILSAIRYLTKAFQYELKIPPEDFQEVAEVVKKYHPGRESKYVADWIEKNGKKLFEHSVNLENSAKVLDELGLRQKLIALHNNPKEIDSLAWLLSREPLPSVPVGQGRGRTAAEIFGKNLTFAHETKNYLAYESITRPKSGRLNGLISRKDAVGEAAVHGPGFYLRQGREGATGSGFTIRVELRPDAREGKDFTLGGHDFVVLKNGDAARVIPGSINMSLLEFYQNLSDGKNVPHGDLALLETYRRGVRKGVTLEPEEEKQLLKLIRADLRKDPFPPSVKEWFGSSLSTQYPELVAESFKAGKGSLVFSLLKQKSGWQKVPEFKKWLSVVMKEELARLPIDTGYSTSLLVNQWLSDPEIQNLPEYDGWLDKLFTSLTSNHWLNEALADGPISTPYVKNHPKAARWLAAVGTKDLESAALESPHIAIAALKAFAEEPRLRKDPVFSEFVEAILKAKSGGDREYHYRDLFKFIAEKILPLPDAADHPEWVEALIKRGGIETEQVQALFVARPEWRDKIVKAHLAYSGNDYVHVPGEKSYLQLLVEGPLSTAEAQNSPQWAEWMKEIMDNPRVGMADRAPPSNAKLFNAILRIPKSAKYPTWMEDQVRLIMERSTFSSDKAELEAILGLGHWQNSDVLRVLLGNRSINYGNLKTAMREGYSISGNRTMAWKEQGACTKWFHALIGVAPQKPRPQFKEVPLIDPNR